MHCFKAGVASDKKQFETILVASLWWFASLCNTVHFVWHYDIMLHSKYTHDTVNYVMTNRSGTDGLNLYIDNMTGRFW